MLSVALALAPFFSGQTTNLSLHLQSAHGLKPQDAKGKNNRNQPKIASLFAAPAGSNIPLTKAREEQITWAIGEYIVDGLLPISTVETSHFKKFMAVMEPRYTVPTRRTLKSKVMDKMEVQLTSEIKEDLKQVEFCTITHDGWTSLANQSYETATVHYVSKDWELKSKVLTTEKVEESHTSEAIRGAMEVVKTKWQLPNPTAVTDSAANEVKAFETLLQWPRLPCFGHNLNLCVRAGLKGNMINRLVAKCRTVVTFFHKSPLANAVLLQKQEALLKTPLNEATFKTVMLIQDSQTRWNTTLDMLERMLRLMPAVHATISDPDATQRVKSLRNQLLNFDDQAIIERVCAVLKPFKTATTVVSGEYKPTTFYVLPLLQHLYNCLNIDSETAAEREMKVAMAQNLNKRPFDRMAYKMAALLHPYTKQLNFLTETERTATEENALVEAQAMVEGKMVALRIKREHEEGDQEPATAQPGEPAEPVMPALPPGLPNLQPGEPALPAMPAPPPDLQPPAAKQPRVEHSLDGVDDLICTGVQRIDPLEKLRQELHRYKLEPPCGPEDDALKWWKTRVTTFPTLSRLATKYLAIPASSVPSERIFSLAGNLITKKRCRLTPASVNQMIFLHRNRKSTPGDEDEEEEGASGGTE